jgi:hypothetical protein
MLNNVMESLDNVHKQKEGISPERWKIYKRVT